MRDPVGAIVPGTAVTITTGNQFQGAGNPGNQLQTGSTLFFKRASDANWTSLPLIFLRTLGNNKYYSATLPAGTFQTGEVIHYYLRIAYDDHDTTFLHAQGDASATTADEAPRRLRRSPSPSRTALSRVSGDLCLRSPTWPSTRMCCQTVAS